MRLARWARGHWAALVLIVVGATYLGGVTLLHSDALSPIDEWVYVDYLHKLPVQGIVHEGELVGEQTREQLACVGISPFGPVGPACDSSLDPADFPGHGVSSASPYTPLYFGPVSWFGEGLHALTGVDLQLGWRLTGVIWLVATLIVIYRLLRRIGFAQLPILTVGMVFVASPFAWWTYSYVSTDAPAVFFGAVLLSLAIDLARTGRRGWLFVLVAVLATATKLTNVIGVSLAVLYLVIRLLLERRRGSPDRLAAPPGVSARTRTLTMLGYPVLALILSVAVQGVWLQLVRLWAVSHLGADQNIGVALTAQELLLQVTNFLPEAIRSSPISAYAPGFVYTPLSWLCVAAVVGGLFLMARRHMSAEFVLPIAIASIVAAPALALTFQIATHSYFQLPPRYGAALLPGFLALLGLLIRNRIASYLVLAYTVALLGVGVWLSAYLAELA